MADWGNDDVSTYEAARPTWGDYSGDLSESSTCLALDDGMPEAGTLDSISAHAHDISSGASAIKAALYSYGTDGYDGSLLADESADASPGAITDDIVTVNMDSYSLVASTNYTIAFGADDTGEDVNIHYSWTSGGYVGYQDWHPTPYWRATAAFTNGSEIDGWIWMTYTTSGGGGRRKYKLWGNHPWTNAILAMKEILPCGCENPAYSHHFDDQTGRIVRWKKGSQILVPINYRGNYGDIRRTLRAA